MFNLTSKLSLTAKTIIGVALIELCAFSFLILTESKIVHDTNLELYSESVNDMSELFTSSITNAVITYDIAEVESNIAQFMQKETVLAVTVVSANDRILASQVRSDVNERNDVIDLSIPIEIEQQPFGRVEFRYDISIIKQNSNIATLLGFQIALVGLVLVALFSYLLGRFLTKRIRELSDSVDAIAKGDLSSEVNIQGNDELSQFAKQIESMRLELLAAHEIMKQGKEELAKEVEFKTSALQDALSLEESSKQREADVFAFLGHEIRTPLSIIMMALQRDTHVNLSLVRENVEQALSLIDDMSLIANVGAKRAIQLAPVDVLVLFESLLSSVRLEAAKSGILLNRHFQIEPGHVLASDQALRQIVLNLLRNAIQHSQGTIIDFTVSLRMTNSTMARLDVSIKDNGTGIAPDLQQTVFESFTQGDTLTPGKGLGLNISRALLNVLGGELQLESDGQSGSDFSFSLELEVVSTSKLSNESQSKLITHSPLKGKRILIVEDNKTIQLLTKTQFMAKGAVTFVANDGVKGIAKLEAEPVDLIVTDYMMPEMDGIEMIKAIRQQGNRTPIIAITAATLGDEQQNLLQAGADLVLSKPLDLARVESFVQAQSTTYSEI